MYVQVLIVVAVSQVYTYVKAYQIVHIKKYLSKAVLEKSLL